MFYTNFVFSELLFGLPLGDALSSYRSDKRQNRKDVGFHFLCLAPKGWKMKAETDCFHFLCLAPKGWKMKAETKLRHNFIFSEHLFGLPLGDALSSYRSDKRQNRKDVCFHFLCLAPKGWKMKAETDCFHFLCLAPEGWKMKAETDCFHFLCLAPEGWKMKAETKLRHNFIFSKHLFGLPLG